MKRLSRKALTRQAKQQRSHATVDAIVEAAARVLMRHGYAASTTNRIAKVAGVSVGTLYQYFRNKDELFDALILRERSRILRVIESEPLDAREPLHAKLRRLLRVVLHSLPYDPELFRRLEYVPNLVLRRRAGEVKQYVAAIARAQLELYRTELRVQDLDLAAFLVVNALEGIGINANKDVWGDRLADELAVLFTRYLTNSG
jgi:AcrR family transcriptional regulator